MKSALTIAGSDCSGGAGIQADLKTMLANGVYGMSVITALTAQNTMGVSDIHDVPSIFVEKEIDSIFTDIVPDAVKIGMVSSSEIIEVISERMKYYQAKNIVIDPVMVSTSGSRLLKEEACVDLERLLFPLGIILTPNIPEAELLSGYTIVGKADMEKAARLIASEYHCAVLCKGGHQVETADDVLCSEDGLEWFLGERIENPNTHGTGCTLSSAIATFLAKGFDLRTAVYKSKKYIEGALRAGLDLGKGVGPLNHGYRINE